MMGERKPLGWNPQSGDIEVRVTQPQTQFRSPAGGLVEGIQREPAASLLQHEVLAITDPYFSGFAEESRLRWEHNKDEVRKGKVAWSGVTTDDYGDVPFTTELTMGTERHWSRFKNKEVYSHLEEARVTLSDTAGDGYRNTPVSVSFKGNKNHGLDSVALSWNGLLKVDSSGTSWVDGKEVLKPFPHMLLNTHNGLDTIVSDSFMIEPDSSTLDRPKLTTIRFNLQEQPSMTLEQSVSNRYTGDTCFGSATYLFSEDGFTRDTTKGRDGLKNPPKNLSQGEYLKLLKATLQLLP